MTCLLFFYCKHGLLLSNSHCYCPETTLYSRLFSVRCLAPGVYLQQVLVHQAWGSSGTTLLKRVGYLLSLRCFYWTETWMCTNTLFDHEGDSTCLVHRVPTSPHWLKRSKLEAFSWQDTSSSITFNQTCQEGPCSAQQSCNSNWEHNGQYRTRKQNTTLWNPTVTTWSSPKTASRYQRETNSRSHQCYGTSPGQQQHQTVLCSVLLQSSKGSHVSEKRTAFMFRIEEKSEQRSRQL
jgi:hypothetical protein